MRAGKSSLPGPLLRNAQDDDPLARLVQVGPQALALWELLELIFGPQGARVRSRAAVQRAVETYESVHALLAATHADLAHVVGPQRAGALMAALELGRRAQRADGTRRPTVRSADDVHRLMAWDMRHLDREHFRALLLNTRHQVIRVATVSVGGLSSAPVHPREVFKDAIKHGAAAIIVVHNHPSGDPEPSRDDVTITEQLRAAGRLVGIEVLDHIIIGDGKYISLRSREILK